MSDLINFEGGSGNKPTMSSVQLVDVINEYRKIEGNNTVLRHIDFMVKIEKELDSDCETFRSEYKASNNQIYRCYLLPKDECILMLMSESRLVRKGVLERLKELENAQHKIPSNFIEAMELATLTLKENQILLIERAEMQPKVVAFENVIDSANTYTLDSVSDILNIGRTTLCKILEAKKWKTIKETNGTSSTRYAEDNGYAKTLYEYIRIGNRDVKTKRFVLRKKGLDKLLKESNGQQ